MFFNVLFGVFLYHTYLFILVKGVVVVVVSARYFISYLIRYLDRYSIR